MIEKQKYFQQAVQAHRSMRDSFYKDIIAIHNKKLVISIDKLTRFIDRSYLMIFWLQVWLKHRLSSKTKLPDVIVVYSPARSPRLPAETTKEFLNRITQSNRDKGALLSIGISCQDEIQEIAVLNGISPPNTDQEQNNILSFTLSLMTITALIIFLKDALKESGNWRKRVETALVLMFARAFTGKRIHLVMTTSNSVLAELLRIAVTGQTQNKVTEILHGIATTLMEPYYGFLEENALSKILYINLIEDLPQFESIERNMLRDTQGQVAINVQMNASIKNNNNTIYLDPSILALNPVLIVGGFSNEPDYLKSSFFKRECQMIEHLRENFPAQTIIYSPHPQIGNNNNELNYFLSRNAIETSHLSTLELIMHCKAIIGTFSSSLFEAALLNRPVFLLPFDEKLLISALLELPTIYRSKPDDEIEDSLIAFCKIALTNKPTDFASYANLCQRRLGVKLAYKPL